MAVWRPIALTLPQYVDANGDAYSGAVLKAYSNGTSTNINMATDSTGGTTMTSVALNASGYPEVSGSEVIPHISEDYKLSLYATQAAADSDTGALWTIDNISVAAGNVVASGSNTASRSAQAKARDWVSVLDFDSVDNTGATDCATGFGYADTASNGGTVWVPDGTYKLDSNVANTSEFLFSAGASISGTGILTGPVAAHAPRDYEACMGLGYFNLWLEGVEFAAGASGTGAAGDPAALVNDTFVATLWRFQFDGTIGTVTVMQTGTINGAAGVGNGLLINQTVAGSGDSFRQVEFRVEDGSIFNGGEATLSMIIHADASYSCGYSVKQFFGGGGTPSETITVDSGTFTATTTSTRQVFTMTMPSVAGKTFGTDDTDCVKIAILIPNDTVCKILISEVKFERGPIRSQFSHYPLFLQHAFIERQLQFYRVNVVDLAAGAGEQQAVTLPFKTRMRLAPTATITAGTRVNLAGGFPVVADIQKYGARYVIEANGVGSYSALAEIVRLDARI